MENTIIPVKRKRTGYGAVIWNKFKRNRVALVGLVFIIVMVLLSIFAKVISP